MNDGLKAIILNINSKGLIKLIKIYLFIFMCLGVQPQLLHAQDSVANKTTKKWVLGSVQVGLWGGSFYALNNAWYANYPKTKFHLYNDWEEWQQMDKMGHFWSTYQISRHTSNIWQWAGLERDKAIWVGAVSGMAYLSVIEILDGYSDKWGFSIPDVMANTAGAGLFLGQELLWKEQRISLKLSYSPYQYGNLKYRADELFGSGDVERLLKDYNGQIIWASINLKSFLPNTKLPKWLNLAVGYNARTMLGGYENKWEDALGNPIVRNDIKRYKRFLVSFDVDLTKIETKNKTLKTIYSIFNVLKVPAPAIEFNTLGKFRFHPVAY
ncbi:MAG: hypothetical protein RLZZ204_352 [Bacteroidota bacterium]|jgi:hypothetical protein